MTRNSRELAVQARKNALEMVFRSKASHIGGALSMIDVLAVLYWDILYTSPGVPDLAGRDRFVLSKGHACTGLYAVLAEMGFFPKDELLTYGADGSRLMAHVSHHVPGIEFSTGSLGHGLPFACGKALAALRTGRTWRAFVLLSDGELDEGSNWEAILFASHHRLDNLIAIIDYNRIQSLGRVEDVLQLEPLADKFRAFGWSVREIDGHDHEGIRTNLQSIPFRSGAPSCLIAKTVKGKGCDFMEDKLQWHYSSPTLEQLQAALAQVSVTE